MRLAARPLGERVGGLGAAEGAESPGGVLADERVAITERVPQCRDRGGIARVAEDDGGVAQQTASSRARELRVAEAAAKRARIETEEIREEREEAVAVGGRCRR